MRINRLDNVPEGSRLRKYASETLRELKSENRMVFLTGIFEDCLQFICLSAPLRVPSVSLILILTTEEFQREQEKQSRRAISRQEVRESARARGFHVGNRIYVDLEAHLNTLSHGAVSFIMDLAGTYMHEVLHIAYPKKSEQEIHDAECSMIESFFEIKLPDSVKALRASDYYAAE